MDQKIPPLSKPFHPRREAGVLSDESLTEDQRHAARQVHGLIAAMFDSDPPPAGAEQHDASQRMGFLPRIDSVRHNRVILISGKRGSGKTALLLSLMDAWSKALSGQQSAKWCADWVEPKGRIIPVDLLDLLPLSDSVSLLLHIVHQFGRVVDALDQKRSGLSPGQPPAPWQLTEEDESASRKCWKQLVRCVAAGWDSNLPGRSANLDLESYTIELDEAVRRRQDLTGCFTEFMYALDRDFCAVYRRAEHVLFVLAIDDADMNPKRSVELLELMRKLWHPRLTFVLTGSSDLFLSTLREHFLGVMLRPLQHLPMAGDATQDEKRGVAADELASATYDKIIPPSHRASLAPLRPKERYAGASVMIDKMLARVPVNPSRPKLTLASYFETDVQLCEALPDRIRALIDLGESVNLFLESPPPGTALPASHVIQQIWSDAAHQLPLAFVHQPGLLDAVSIDEESGSLRVEMPGLKGDIKYRKLFKAVCHASESMAIARFAWISRLDATLDQGRVLSAIPNAALMLAANIAADQPGGTYVGNPSQLTGFEPIFAWTEFSPKAQFAWPLPANMSFLDLAVLSARWKAATHNWIDMSEPMVLKLPDVDMLARKFLRLVVLTLQKSKEVDPFAKDWTWEHLAGEVFRLIARSRSESITETMSYSWARRCAGLLAAPEFGLTHEGAKQWLRALKKAAGGSWPDLAGTLAVERRRSSAAAQGKDPEAGLRNESDSVLDNFDSVAAETKHPWLSYVGGRNT